MAEPIFRTDGEPKVDPWTRGCRRLLAAMVADHVETVLALGAKALHQTPVDFNHHQTRGTARFRGGRLFGSSIRPSRDRLRPTEVVLAKRELRFADAPAERGPFHSITAALVELDMDPDAHLAVMGQAYIRLRRRVADADALCARRRAKRGQTPDTIATGDRSGREGPFPLEIEASEDGLDTKNDHGVSFR